MQHHRLTALSTVFLSLLAITTSQSDEEDPGRNLTTSFRTGKLFSIFQLVRFKNGPCAGANSRNGTCFTQEECNTRGGSSSGTCAAGYGVCCIFSLNCGSTSSENCTYLAQPSNVAASISPCKYKICKCDSSICRIRFDFNIFQIGNPTAGTVVEASAITTNGDAIGECSLDQFSLTAPGNFAPPVICGFNNGQHMIVDASDACHEARFTLTGSASRAWDIKVTQYKCGDNGLGGDDGCLQYFTGMSGQVASFAFPTSSSSVPPSATHLQDQSYGMCWRTEQGQCGICFTAVIESDVTETGSFGLSNPPGNAAKGSADNRCATDYLLIPHAEANSPRPGDTFVVTTDISLSTTRLKTRVCGRMFNINANGLSRFVPSTICTQSRPFRLGFVTDSSEVTQKATGAQWNEQAARPGGIIGFHLNWEQQACA